MSRIASLITIHPTRRCGSPEARPTPHLGSISDSMRMLTSISCRSCRRSRGRPGLSTSLDEGQAFELTDAFPGEVEVLADLAEGHRGVGFEAEPHPDDGGLAVVELADPAKIRARSSASPRTSSGGRMRSSVRTSSMMKPPSSSGPSASWGQVVDLDRLGDDPDLLLGEPERLADLVGGGGPAQFRSVRTVETRRHFASRLTM